MNSLITALNANILMIGTDRNIFKEGSAVRQRMIDYGSLVKRLDIIVFSRKNYRLAGHELTPQKIAPNIFVWPTNSWSRLLYSRDAVRIAKKQLIVDGQFLADLVTTQDPFETGLAGLKIAARFHKPLQAQIHTDFLDRHFAAESILNRVRITIAKDVLARAAGIRTVSEKIKVSLPVFDHTLSAKTDVLPIFVDMKNIHDAAPIATNSLRQKYPGFDSILLMASRFSPEKNIPLALEVFAEVLEKKPRTALVIVGDTGGKTKRERNEKAKILIRIDKLDLTKNVFVEPWNDDLVPYYKSADIFLVTSEYEGYGMALVAAVAAGCPLVSTDVGVASEILGPLASELISPVGDAKAIAEKILSVLSQPDFKKKFQAYSSDFVLRTLSHEQYLKKYQELWEKLL